MDGQLPARQKSKLRKTQKSIPELLNLVFADYKPNTQRVYSRIFTEFLRWAEIKSPQELLQVDSFTILEYKAHLKDSGKKPASINQALSALKKIFKVLSEFGYFESDPLKSSVIRSERVSPLSNKGSLLVSQLSELIRINQVLPYDSRSGDLLRIRNDLLIRFLYLTAARRSEAAGLRWEHLQQDGAYQVIVLPETKSGLPQRLKIRQELYAGILSWKQTLLEAGVETPWVFPSLSQRTYAQQMTGKGINDVVVRLGKAIGLEISAHYLRHTAITLALEVGEPLQKVQAYARHASANTTLRYYHDQELLKQNPTDRLPMI